MGGGGGRGGGGGGACEWAGQRWLLKKHVPWSKKSFARDSKSSSKQNKVTANAFDVGEVGADMS